MKKIVLSLAALGFILVGCSKNEVSDLEYPDRYSDPNTIGFHTSTTKAEISSVSVLQSDGNGFKVYATDNTASTSWYRDYSGGAVDGTNNYVYATNFWKWQQASQPQWPYMSGFPMNFYAYYPVAPDGFSLTSAEPSALAAEITIGDTQADLLAAKAEAVVKPPGGTLALTFKHILSKVNFGVIAGKGMTVIVQSVGIQHVKNKNAYDYLTGSWGTTVTGDKGYSYFNKPATPLSVTGIDDSEKTAAPFYATIPHSNHLMLMPQNRTDAWNTQTASAASGAHIDIIYRMESAGDVNGIGYQKASDYLRHYPSFTNTGWGSPSITIGTDGGKYNGALYIKAGLPLMVTWEEGKGYTYNLCLGTVDSSNGYYLDQFYYDDKGNLTNIPVIGPDGQVTIGDIVSDGTIHFRVDVTDWGADITEPLDGAYD